jgi:hypothetical protein
MGIYRPIFTIFTPKIHSQNMCVCVYIYIYTTKLVFMWHKSLRLGSESANSVFLVINGIQMS